jgi:predicted transcriptional regulator
MQKNEIIKALELSENEKAILIAVKEQRIAKNASMIARFANLSRTAALHTLEKLAKWKLVRKIRSGKHWVWLPREL